MEALLSTDYPITAALLASVVLLLLVMGLFSLVDKTAVPPPLPRAPAPPPRAPAPPPKNLSVKELQECTGEGGKPLYTACNGYVFDLGSHPTGPDFYGPGAHYHCFTGRDATLMFAKMELNPDAVAGQSMSSLGAHEVDTMRDWLAKLEMKYDLVGYLTDGHVPRSVESEAAAAAAFAARNQKVE